MGGYGCSVSQCLILHIIKGKAPGCQYMTNWDRANLVLCSRLHRLHQSMPTGQTGSSNRSDRRGDLPRTFKPKRPEVGTWKTNEVKVQGRTAN